MATKSINKLVMIASSTGGPKALHQVIPLLPKEIDAPVVIVQHMPEGFTKSLAERLNDVSQLSVQEAADGIPLEKGHGYLARGGVHLQLEQGKYGKLFLKETSEPPVNGLRPCANVTFNSLKNISVSMIIFVVLTGMGSDGAAGIHQLQGTCNTYTIAQDRESCVVYGMPKAVVDRGVADIVLPLDKISEEIINKTGVC